MDRRRIEPDACWPKLGRHLSRVGGLSLAAWLLMTGCASAPATTGADDDVEQAINALAVAIEAQDCNGVWSHMAEDVQLHFGAQDVFCDYLRDNSATFQDWVVQLHDRVAAGDYAHYAYLPNDPEGHLRLKWSDGVWSFESLREPKSFDELAQQFIDYVWTRQFLLQLSSYLEVAEPFRGDEILSAVMLALSMGQSVAEVSFDGPFARVMLNHSVLVQFKYQKHEDASLLQEADGAWELYRCHLYP